MKIKKVICYFLGVGFLIYIGSDLFRKKTIYIKIIKSPDIYASYIGFDEKSKLPKQIEFGFTKKGFDSWLLDINKRNIRKISQDFLKKNIIASQYWLTLNYSSLNEKRDLIKKYKIYIVHYEDNNVYLLPVNEISLVIE